MARTNAERLTRERARSLLHSLLILGGMLVLVALVARIILGPSVLPWLAAGFAISALLSPRPHPERLLRWSGGRPLPPGVAAYLEQTARELAAGAELERPPVLLYFDRSEPNAFAIGDAKRSAIGLTAGLLERLTPPEIAAILAHEISHLRNGDTRVMALVASAARLAGTMSLMGVFLLFFNLPLLLMGAATVSPTALLLLVGAPMLATVLQLSLSRAREIDADLSAVELTDDPGHLASALVKIQTRQRRLMEHLLTQVYGGTWWRTHPAAEERIRLLRQIERQSRLTPASS